MAAAKDAKLMAGWQNFEDLTDVGLLKPISTDALARRTRPTLAAKFIAPAALRDPSPKQTGQSGLIVPRKPFERTGTQ